MGNVCVCACVCVHMCFPTHKHSQTHCRLNFYVHHKIPSCLLLAILLGALMPKDRDGEGQLKCRNIAC